MRTPLPENRLQDSCYAILDSPTTAVQVVEAAQKNQVRLPAGAVLTCSLINRDAVKAPVKKIGWQRYKQGLTNLLITDRDKLLHAFIGFKEVGVNTSRWLKQATTEVQEHVLAGIWDEHVGNVNAVILENIDAAALKEWENCKTGTKPVPMRDAPYWNCAAKTRRPKNHLERLLQLSGCSDLTEAD